MDSRIAIPLKETPLERLKKALDDFERRVGTLEAKSTLLEPQLVEITQALQYLIACVGEHERRLDQGEVWLLECIEAKR